VRSSNRAYTKFVVYPPGRGCIRFDPSILHPVRQNLLTGRSDISSKKFGRRRMGGEGGRKTNKREVGNSSVAGTPRIRTNTQNAMRDDPTNYNNNNVPIYNKYIRSYIIIRSSACVIRVLLVPRGAPFQRQLAHLRTVPVRQNELVISRERHDRGREVGGCLEHILDRQPFAPSLEGVPPHGYHYAIACGARGGDRSSLRGRSGRSR
jgi:hypothetical protein